MPQLAKNDIQFMDEASRQAMLYVFKIMDSLSGGAFSRGYREATVRERITEWDSLGPDQMQMLREKMGDEWVLKQAGEIEKIRRSVDVGVVNNNVMAV